jgi:two-component system, NarL family, nitrate/nitrite response regulator NarL
MDTIKILLVDDHTLFREALSRWLEGEPDLEMTAHCASVHDALEILRRRPIDIVLLDHDLGKERGFQFLTDVRDLNFDGRLLMVTAGMTGAESLKALDLGAHGIFLKHSSPRLLAEAIRKVMAGEKWLDPACVQTLIEAAKRPERPSRNRPFTERESQVLRGILEGLSNKEIGVRLKISESSVKAALQQLFQKTEVRTRSQLVRIALEEHSGSWR